MTRVHWVTGADLGIPEARDPLGLRDQDFVLVRQDNGDSVRYFVMLQLPLAGESLTAFLDAVALIQKIASIAEAEDHHPDLHLTNYKKLTIELSTHAIGGLSENDFILAAKIDQLFPAS